MATPSVKPKSDRRPAACSVPDGEPVPVIKGSHVYLIDGSGYIFRAFFQSQNVKSKTSDRPVFFRSDGTPTGAVNLFCSMLWKVLKESKLAERPTHIAVIF